MSANDLLEDRLRDAFVHRAKATTVGPPRGLPPVRLAPSPTPPAQWRRPRWIPLAAGLVAAAAAFATFVVLRDERGRVSDRTDLHPVDDGEVEPQDDGGVPPDKLLQYEATDLPPGYVPVEPSDGQSDTLEAIRPMEFGVNCLEWHVEGASTLECDKVFGVRSLYYSRPDTGEGVSVSTLVNAPVPGLYGPADEPTTVQGAPAWISGSASEGPLLLTWDAQPGVTVIVAAVGPAVTDDQLLAFAEGLRPRQVTPPADMAYAVAELEVPGLYVSGDDEPVTVYLWARPGPDGCLGALLGNDSLPCDPTGWAEDEMSISSSGTSTVVAGAVPPEVEQVQVETFTGETVDAELVDPGGPFRQRFFLTLVGHGGAAGAVGRAADGTEVGRWTAGQ